MWEKGLPEYLQHDLDAFKQGRAEGASLLDCLWGELYGSINDAEVGCGAITHEHAEYLRDKYLRVPLKGLGKMKLYHGSRNENIILTYGLGNEKHDFGKGFYLTDSLQLAKEWAVAANPFDKGWVHTYELDCQDLAMYDFASDESDYLPWMAELMKHRAGDDGRYYRESAPKFIAKYGVNIDPYDVIRGYRADASYFYICKSFVRNNIGVSFLGTLLHLGEFGLQYVLKSEKAFAAIREIESEKIAVSPEEFHKQYNLRDSSARAKMYESIEDDPRNDLSRTFKDLI